MVVGAAGAFERSGGNAVESRRRDVAPFPVRGGTWIGPPGGVAEIVADGGGGAQLQGAEVEGMAPSPGDEPAEEVLGHAGMGGQELAGGVVRHGRTVAVRRVRRTGLESAPL